MQLVLYFPVMYDPQKSSSIAINTRCIDHFHKTFDYDDEISNTLVIQILKLFVALFFAISVDRCSPTLRKQFNDNLIRQFKIEFKRLVKRKHVPRPNIKRDTKLGIHLIHGEEGYTLNSTELRVVEWKFSELDLDHDNTLSFRELRSLRRVVRRVVRPRECARRFAKRCDSNKNRRLERKEWSLCMGINIGGEFSVVFQFCGLSCFSRCGLPSQLKSQRTINVLFPLLTYISFVDLQIIADTSILCHNDSFL